MIRDLFGLDMAGEPDLGPVPLLPNDAETLCLCDSGEHDTPANGKPCAKCFPNCAVSGANEEG